MVVTNSTLMHKYLKPQVIFVLTLSLLLFFWLTPERRSPDQEIYEIVYRAALDCGTALLWAATSSHCPSTSFTRAEPRCKLTSMKHQQMGDEDPCATCGKSRR